MQAGGKRKVAMITGATGEVGAAIARELASAGAQLVLCATDRSGLDALAAQIGPEDVDVVTMAGAHAAAIAECVAEVTRRCGAVEILVNNATALPGKPLSALTADDVGLALETALAQPMHFMREVVPHMMRLGHGRVVNVSELAYLGRADQANVGAARAGLFGLTRAVALESARSGVTVNTVVKGDIATMDTSDAQLEKLAGSIPVRRLGTPAEVARAVGFFAAASSKYITGQTLFVCGGKSVHFSMSV